MKKLLLWFGLFPLISQGQTGPAGVGNSTNNEIWLVAEENVYIDAGSTAGGNDASIQQWTDVSGNDNHAIQITTEQQPSLKTSEVNGFSALRFDGSNDRMLAAGISTSNQLTLFVVVRHNGLNHNNDGIIHAAPTGNAFSVDGNSKVVGMWTQVSDGVVWGRGVESDKTIQSISKVTALSTGQFYIISQDYNGSAINQYVNGAIAGTASYDGTLDSWTDFGLGRQGDETLNGDIAEIIVYTNSLNTAQRYIIQNYLAAKYDIGLTANDIYNEDEAGASNFDYEVAGIGRVDASNIQSESQGTGAVRMLNPTNLGNDEFLIWGHDNGDFEASNISDVPGDVQARLDRVWRVSERNAANSASVDVGSVDIRWDLTGLGPVFTSDLRLIIDTDNDGIFSDESPISGATNISGAIYEFSTISGLSDNLRFTLGTTNLSGTPLPIELASFETRVEDENVVITWSTVSEINNDFFTIERSENGNYWTAIDSMYGAGNSTQLLHYQYVDQYPIVGLSYYRVKQTDYDGQFSYSPVKSVHLQQLQQPDLLLFPNPTSKFLTIESGENKTSTLAIVNKMGEDVSHLIKVFSQSKHNIVIDVSALGSGIYVIKTATSIKKFYKTSN